MRGPMECSTRSLITPLTGLILAATAHGAAPVTYQDGRLDNGIVSVSFADDAGFTIRDARSGDVLLSDSRFQLPRGKQGSCT